MEADIAIRKADAASEAKGLFLANMTHELRSVSLRSITLCFVLTTRL